MPVYDLDLDTSDYFVKFTMDPPYGKYPIIGLDIGDVSNCGGGARLTWSPEEARKIAGWLIRASYSIENG